LGDESLHNSPAGEKDKENWYVVSRQFDIWDYCCKGIVGVGGNWAGEGLAGKEGYWIFPENY